MGKAKVAIHVKENQRKTSIIPNPLDWNAQVRSMYDYNISITVNSCQISKFLSISMFEIKIMNLGDRFKPICMLFCLNPCNWSCIIPDMTCIQQKKISRNMHKRGNDMCACTNVIMVVVVF